MTFLLCRKLTIVFCLLSIPPRLKVLQIQHFRLIDARIPFSVKADCCPNLATIPFLDDYTRFLSKADYFYSSGVVLELMHEPVV
jgi:hypothetical protein